VCSGGYGRGFGERGSYTPRPVTKERSTTGWSDTCYNSRTWY